MKDNSNLKVQEERLAECMNMAKQLNDHGITKVEFPNRKEIDARFNDFIRTGTGWVGSVELPSLNRIADVVLATDKATTSSINLRYIE